MKSVESVASSSENCTTGAASEKEGKASPPFNGDQYDHSVGRRSVASVSRINSIFPRGDNIHMTSSRTNSSKFSFLRGFLDAKLIA